MDYKTDFEHKILYKPTVGYVIEYHAYTVSKVNVNVFIKFEFGLDGAFLELSLPKPQTLSFQFACM